MAILSMFFLVFGVMGFISNLFFRAIWLYCEWREGNEIDWQRQVMLTFAVPGAYLFVMIELMMVEGFVFIG
jgi:hypothetical protein